MCHCLWLYITRTARVWLDGKCIMNLKGHEQAVWSVAMITDQGLMLTGLLSFHIIQVHVEWKNQPRIFFAVAFVVWIIILMILKILATISIEQSLSKYMIHTASADRTIKIWKAGSCIKTCTGHTDCVRSISVLSSSEFISSSNDK